MRGCCPGVELVCSAFTNTHSVPCSGTKPQWSTSRIASWTMGWNFCCSTTCRFPGFEYLTLFPTRSNPTSSRMPTIPIAVAPLPCHSSLWRRWMSSDLLWTKAKKTTRPRTGSPSSRQHKLFLSYEKVQTLLVVSADSQIRNPTLFITLHAKCNYHFGKTLAPCCDSRKRVNTWNVMYSAEHVSICSF